MENLFEKNVVGIKSDIVDKFNRGTLIDYLSENVLEIKRDSETNEIEYLVFTMGGPHIELDMCVERVGVVCGYDGFGGSKTKFSPIKWDLWKKIEEEILSNFE